MTKDCCAGRREEGGFIGAWAERKPRELCRNSWRHLEITASTHLQRVLRTFPYLHHHILPTFIRPRCAATHRRLKNHDTASSERGRSQRQARASRLRHSRLLHSTDNSSQGLWRCGSMPALLHAHGPQRGDVLPAHLAPLPQRAGRQAAAASGDTAAPRQDSRPQGPAAASNSITRMPCRE